MLNFNDPFTFTGYSFQSAIRKAIEAHPECASHTIIATSSKSFVDNDWNILEVKTQGPWIPDPNGPDHAIFTFVTNIPDRKTPKDGYEPSNLPRLASLNAGNSVFIWDEHLVKV